MDFLWVIYWVVLLISLIFSIYIIIKRNKLLGIIQSCLTIIFPIYAFIYVLNRDFASGESELSFIVSSLLKGELGAICLVLLLVILVGVFVYNLFTLCMKK